MNARKKTIIWVAIFLLISLGTFSLLHKCKNICYSRTENTYALGKDEAVLFVKNQGMSFQEAYELLKKQVKLPFIENKGFVVDGEIFFPQKKKKYYVYWAEDTLDGDGYYVNPKTKTVRRFDAVGGKIYFKKGNATDNAVIINDCLDSK